MLGGATPAPAAGRAAQGPAPPARGVAAARAPRPLDRASRERLASHRGAAPRPRAAPPAPAPRRARPVARAAGEEAAPALDAADGEGVIAGYRTQDVLAILRKRVCPDLPPGTEVWSCGVGTHMSSKCAWSLRFSSEGAFREEIKSKDFTTRWGFSGAPGDACWEVDSAGVPKGLQLDDHENLLLVTWLRTGAWLLPGVARHLVFDEFCRRPGAGGDLGGAGQQWSGTTPFLTWEGSLDGDLLAGGAGGDGAPGGAGGGDLGPESDLVALRVRLASGRLWAYVMVSSTSWLPRGICLPYGDREWWDFGEWRLWSFQDPRGGEGGGGGVGFGRRPVGSRSNPPGSRWAQGGDRGGRARRGRGRPVVVPSPKLIEHASAAGGRNTYEVLDVQLVPESAADPAGPVAAGGSLREPPAPVVTPDDTAFDPYDRKRGHALRGWVTLSGHVVVPVEIDGTPVGCFLVDTGASGLVVESRVAQQLGLRGFGEIFVTGMGGNTRSQFRRADTLRVGNAVIRDPVMMELPVAPIVSATAHTGPISGILGYDFFRRVTLSLPPLPRSQGRRSAAPEAITIRMWNPEDYAPPAHVERKWQPIRMISNLPHISVRFVGPDHNEHSALFMLDSGGGSIDMMLHPRAVDELGLGPVVGQAPSRLVKGVGQDVEVKWHSLPWVELSGRRYYNVDCLLAQGAGSGLDLSLYTAGIVCGDLLFRSEVVLDYARQRVAFLPRPGTGEGLRGLPGSEASRALSWSAFGVIGPAGLADGLVGGDQDEAD